LPLIRYDFRVKASETTSLAEECARVAHAIVPCPVCHEHEIAADDADAENRAYRRATNAWKGGEPGFQGIGRDKAIEVVKAVLNSASKCCPKCG
jgi:hypothetical protein